MVSKGATADANAMPAVGRLLITQVGATDEAVAVPGGVAKVKSKLAAGATELAVASPADGSCV